jgi:hypothetical protein
MTSALVVVARCTFAIGDLLWGFLRLCIVQEALKDCLRAFRYIVPHHGGDLLGALKWLGFRDRISCCYNRVTVDSDAVCDVCDLTASHPANIAQLSASDLLPVSQGLSPLNSSINAPTAANLLWK